MPAVPVSLVQNGEVSSPLHKTKRKIRTGPVAIDIDINSTIMLKRQRDKEDETTISSKKIKSGNLFIHASVQDNAAEDYGQPCCQK